MTVTFLGTCSGGGPNESRNCSSLVLDCLRDGSLWSAYICTCYIAVKSPTVSEGTTRQFAFQPPDTPLWLKPQSVTKILITHLHADHVMGEQIPQHKPLPHAEPNSQTQPRVEIYGPAGIRTFVRSILTMTLTRTAEKYVVHELLRTDDVPTSCDLDVMHSSELEGRDIWCSEDGFWKGFTLGRGALGDVVVDAGPILHRDPCLGYIFSEPDAPKRKIVILGDTYDPSPIIPLCTSASLLVHEATDAHIPPQISQNRRTPELVLRTALARGHSIPQMAGEFARTIGTEKLVLNHIGGRFPAPRHDRDARSNVMREIERQATEAWGSGRYAIAAWDFMRVAVPAPEYTPAQSQPYPVTEQVVYADPNPAEGLVYVNNKKRKW
ncbi:beta-lactamase-like protein [Mycena vitilis]|nr:beta-lactamase-like protein [Mycena vitilis]